MERRVQYNLLSTAVIELTDSVFQWFREFRVNHYFGYKVPTPDQTCLLYSVQLYDLTKATGYVKPARVHFQYAVCTHTDGKVMSSRHARRVPQKCTCQRHWQQATAVLTEKDHLSRITPPFPFRCLWDKDFVLLRVSFRGIGL